MAKGMSKQQAAGYLGVANNPQTSKSTQHHARQTIMAAASKGGGPQLAGKIGVTTNPKASPSSQHQARVDIIQSVARR